MAAYGVYVPVARPANDPDDEEFKICACPEMKCLSSGFVWGPILICAGGFGAIFVSFFVPDKRLAWGLVGFVSSACGEAVPASRGILRL
jgi:hypothetical protein